MVAVMEMKRLMMEGKRQMMNATVGSHDGENWSKTRTRMMMRKRRKRTSLQEKA